MDREKFKLLVFDTSGETETVLYEALAGFSIKLLSANNQNDAFDFLWRESPVDLVIAEFDSADTSEFSFIRQLRKGTGFAEMNENDMPVAALNKYITKTAYASSIKKVPVVVVSSENSKESVLSARGFAVRGFLTRPFAADRFRQTILKAAPNLEENAEPAKV